MKGSIAALILPLATLMPIHAVAQTNSLASTLEVYVFPSEGQDSAQQSKDESECYQWAATSTGGDPFDLAKQQNADERQARTTSKRRMR